jgi:hypothetical protein
MVIFKNMGGLEIDLKFFLEKDKKFQIHHSIFCDISELINSCNSNIDDFFFKKLFDKIDNKSEFTDDEKLKIKLILLKYIVYNEVKKDNSKASEIIEKVNRIPFFKQSFPSKLINIDYSNFLT